jgi:hypothetical protein
MTSTVADILQRIEALSQSEQQELVTAICDRWGIANGSEATDWAESIRDKIDEAYASTEPAVDGSTFIQKRRSAIYQDPLTPIQIVSSRRRTLESYPTAPHTDRAPDIPARSA